MTAGIRLLDLHPAWVDHGDRRGLGVEFDCMVCHCRGRLMILFANPLDGGPAWEGNGFALLYDRLPEDQKDGPILNRSCGPHRWTREGDAFETLTMRPSVDAYECGHLTLTAGGFR